MSDLVRPLPASKRLRREGDVDMPLAILDSADTQVYRQAMAQAEAIRDRDMPETIEDVSQTPAAASQARVQWSAMNTRSVPHISMLPSMSFSPFDIESTQVDIPATQPDFTPTQRDTQIDQTPTPVVPSVGLHQQKRQWIFTFCS